MLTVRAVDTNQMLQGGNALADLCDLLAKTAMIEKPSRLGVVQKFHVGVGGITKVDGDPCGPGAQYAQHAEQNRRMIVGVDGRPLFRLDAVSPHPAGDALAEGARFSVGIASVPVENRDPLGMEIRALVEIIDRSHRFPCWWRAERPARQDGRGARPSTNQLRRQPR